MILKNQPFLLHLEVRMFSLKEYLCMDFNSSAKSLEFYLKQKNTLILVGMALRKNMSKIFRIEIIRETLEAFV